MIDLRSDTVTKPTQEMREAMYNAEVGDDVYREDPTVNRLEELAAEILGKEAALFATSGTQGNQIAVLTHARPGDEIILEADAHIFYYEAAAASALAGVQTRTIAGHRGKIPLNELKRAIRGTDIHFPKTALIALENTHNRAGGAVLPLDYMQEVYQLAQDKQVPVHLDGARLFNAAVALKVEAKEITKYVDTVQVCLSKGLSAPMGSIIAGSRDWIEQARKWRKRLGGGMRQSGLMAAPGIIALTKMVDRLEEDHFLAKKLAEGLQYISGIRLDLETVETNIVVFDIEAMGITAKELVAELKSEGVLGSVFGEYLVRLTTHREINLDDINQTISILSKIAQRHFVH